MAGFAGNYSERKGLLAPSAALVLQVFAGNYSERKGQDRHGIKKRSKLFAGNYSERKGVLHDFLHLRGTIVFAGNYSERKGSGSSSTPSDSETVCGEL